MESKIFISFRNKQINTGRNKNKIISLNKVYKYYENEDNKDKINFIDYVMNDIYDKFHKEHDILFKIYSNNCFNYVIYKGISDLHGIKDIKLRGNYIYNKNQFKKVSLNQYCKYIETNNLD